MTENQRKFITSEVISNDGNETIWKSLRDSFSSRDCLGYWRYPLFSKVGEGRKEPDILIVDRELGLIIIEIENIDIDQITAVNGDQWEFREDTAIFANPAIRTNRSLQTLLGYCDREDAIFRKITGRALVALPNITIEEWQQKGFDQLPNCPAIIFKNNLGKTDVCETIFQAQAMVTGEQLSDEQWKILCAVVSGTPILRKSSTANFSNNKTRAAIVSILGEWLYETDLQQEHIGKEIPPGVQRIRGIAGSGKTVLLCQKAANMYLKHPDWDIALVFFTRSLYTQIESLLDRWLRRFSNGDVTYNNRVKSKLKVLHAWGGSYKAGLYSMICEQHKIDPLKIIRGLSPSEGLAECSKRLLEEIEIEPMFDAVLIDEGQDLVSEDERKFEENDELKQAIYWMAYKSLRPCDREKPEQRRLIWAYDEAQNLDSQKIPMAKELFGESLTNLVSGQHKGGIKKSEIMHHCYRTPGAILTTAHALGMGLLRPYGMLQGLTNKNSWEAIGYQVQKGEFRSGQEITLHRPPENSPNLLPKLWGQPVLEFETYENRIEELKALAERIKYNLNQDGFKPSEDILIIVLGSPQEASQLETEVGQFLMNQGIDIFIAAATGLNQLNPNFEDKTLNPDKFWYEGGVTISRIHRAKGNEANMVYIVGVDKVAEKENHPNLRNQLFVALTRSKGWACLTGIDDYPFYDEIEEVIESKDTFTFTYKKPPQINTGEETDME